MIYLFYAGAAAAFVAGWYGTSYLFARYTKFGEGRTFCPACWEWTDHGIPLGLAAFFWPVTLALWAGGQTFFGLNKGATACAEVGSRKRTIVLDRAEGLKRLMAADRAERDRYLEAAHKEVEVFLDYGRRT